MGFSIVVSMSCPYRITQSRGSVRLGNGFSSGNQTWQWRTPHVEVILPLSHAFLVGFQPPLMTPPGIYELLGLDSKGLRAGTHATNRES